MKLIYENKRGKVVMNGGGGDGFNIIEISGLSLPEVDTEATYYPNVAGRKTESVTLMERTITLSGDLCDRSNRKIGQAAGVFSLPGTIIINSNGKIRKISARCVSFEPNKRRGAYIPFVAQFVADDPYFTDMYESKVSIFKCKKEISSPFALPCVMSTRITEGEIVNSGDGAMEPIFEITSLNGAVCPEGIVIKNLENGDEIKLNCDIKEGETITVDIEKRKVTSDIRGNMITFLADDAHITDFKIDTGISTLSITATNIEGVLVASCIFSNRYLYALI